MDGNSTKLIDRGISAAVLSNKVNVAGRRRASRKQGGTQVQPGRNWVNTQDPGFEAGHKHRRASLSRQISVECTRQLKPTPVVKPHAVQPPRAVVREQMLEGALFHRFSRRSEERRVGKE